MSQVAMPTARRAKWRDLWGVVCFLVVLYLAYARLTQLMVIPGDPQRSDALGRMGLADFQDVIYYPLQAIRDGVNPYDASPEPLPDGSPRYRQRYPVLNLFPLYSPLIFLLYWPLAGFDFVTSAWLYVVLNVGLLLWFAYQCWRWAGVKPTVGSWFMLAALMLATQAGRANFIGGETALALALTSGAAAISTNPTFAALFLTLSSFKPTFGFPLGILMLAAGRYRAVFLGWLTGFVIGMGGLLLIFQKQHDIPNMLQILQQNQAIAESDPDWSALSSAKRVDSAAALERVLSSFPSGLKYLGNWLVFGLAGFALHRLKPYAANPDAWRLSYCIITLATVSCMYHITYDGLLLWAPIVCLLFMAPANGNALLPRWRYAAAALTSVPMFNIFATDGVLKIVSQVTPNMTIANSQVAQIVWTVVCTANGVSLLLALICMVYLAIRLASATAVEAASSQS